MAKEKTAADYVAEGKALAKQGHYDRAIEHYNLAIEIDPDCHEAYANRGDAYYNLGQLELEVESYSLAVEKAPQNEEYRATKIRILLNQGKFEDAEQFLDESIEALPNSAELLRYKGMILQFHLRFEDAIMEFDKAIAISPDANYYNPKIYILNMLGRYSEAEAVARQAIELYPTDPEITQSMGEAFLHQGKFEDALAFFNEAIALGVEDMSEACGNKAITLFNLGRYDEAISALDQAELDQDILEQKMYFLSRLERYDDALATLNGAIESDPENDHYKQHKAEFLHSRGDNDAALEILGECPTNLKEEYIVGFLMNQEAMNYYPVKGMILQALGREDEALAAYDQGIEANPDFDVESYIRKAMLLQSMGRMDELRECYQAVINNTDKLIHMSSDKSALLCLKAKAFIELGNDDQALKCLDLAKQDNIRIGGEGIRINMFMDNMLSDEYQVLKERVVDAEIAANDNPLAGDGIGLGAAKDQEVQSIGCDSQLLDE